MDTGSTALERVFTHRIELAIALYRALMYAEAVEELRQFGRQIRHEHGKVWHKDVWIAAYHVKPVLKDLSNLGLIEEALSTDLRSFILTCEDQKNEARTSAFRILEEAVEQDRLAHQGDVSPVVGA